MLYRGVTPSLSPLAQLGRVSVSKTEEWGFDSLTDCLSTLTIKY